MKALTIASLDAALRHWHSAPDVRHPLFSLPIVKDPRPERKGRLFPEHPKPCQCISCSRDRATGRSD